MPRPETGERDRWDCLLAAYSVLWQRYASNTTLQWQVPAFAITAQGGLLAGVLVSSGAIRVVLGAIAVLVGGLGVVAMRRIELTARWDREMLDKYEALLLPHDQNLRLLHGYSFPARLRARPLESATGRAKSVELWIIRHAPPGLILMAATLCLAATTLTVALLR